MVEYGRQRGKRMALRVKKDGKHIDISNYIAYGEWQARPGDMDTRLFIHGDDLNMQIHKCPWFEEWKKHDLLEYGRIYCQYIDEAIVEGYNSQMKLDVLQNRSAGADYCDFWFRKAGMTEEDFEKINKTKSKLGGKAIMPWDYHIAHLYKALEDVIIQELGERAKDAIKAALDMFAKNYGQESADIILSLKDTDFNILPK